MQAIELQSLKPNQSLPEAESYGATTYPSVAVDMGTAEDASIVCYDIPINCSTDEPLITSTVTAAVIANLTLTTLLPLLLSTTNVNISNMSTFNTTSTAYNPIVENVTFDNVTSQFDSIDANSSFLDNSSAFGDELVPTESDFLLNNSFSDFEVSSSAFSDVVTESSNPKRTDSTIPYLITIIANMFLTSKAKTKSSRVEEELNATQVTMNMTAKETTESLFNDTTDELDLNTIGEFETVTNDELESTTTEESESTTEVNESTTASEADANRICYVKKCLPTQTESTKPPQPATVAHVEEPPTTPYDMETRKRLRRLCWETMFGQELVKLTVMDLVRITELVIMQSF